MKKEDTPTEWMTSKEVQKALKIKACDVMHLREAGKLKYKKQRNAFLYSIASGGQKAKV